MDAIPAQRARGFELTLETRTLPIIVIRGAGGVCGYLNSCPHTGVRLEWRADDFFDAEGEHLQCATHGALFRSDDGLCVAGPCQGRNLIPVDLAIEQEEVFAIDPERLPGTARARGR